MELKQLSYFVAVAEEGSITAAARRLYISQPPLSTQMKLLEQELGCQLFERGRSAIRLTEQGAILYRHALTLLEISRAARDEVLSSTGEVRGTLRLGMAIACRAACELSNAVGLGGDLSGRGSRGGRFYSLGGWFFLLGGDLYMHRGGCLYLLRGTLALGRGSGHLHHHGVGPGGGDANRVDNGSVASVS